MADERKDKRFSRSDIIGALGLLAFFAIVGYAAYRFWPFLSDAYQAGGVQGVVERVQDMGASGVFVLLGMQILQVVITFIPGEVVQLAAGLMYGPWLGTLIILVGAAIAGAIIFALVRKLGAPFMRDMVGEAHTEKFRQFEASGKLDMVVLILFLIPGLPKDTFAYLVPLTDMPMKRYLLLTTLGRIPGVFVSCFAAADLAQGNYLRAGILFVVGAAVAIVGVWQRERVERAVDAFNQGRGTDEDAKGRDGSSDGTAQPADDPARAKDE